MAARNPREIMLFYHRGKAVQTSAAKRGLLFVSRVSILEEDGEATLLGDLGYFANRQSALASPCVAPPPLPTTSRCRSRRAKSCMSLARLR
ncbi:hypothetical protein QFZ99_005014 [Paraburkholderia atlantica]|uniref:hypothetical protein n=1 Tax=Paraburkholderia atlantica TaxID=2654982 RepID=UPI003D1DAB97